ncbi:MAG: hypothetical protein Tsb002_27660 [Wenzhouxiangellaceae bacterium]
MTVACGPEESYFEHADVVFEGVVINREAVDEQSENGICWTIEKGENCGPKVAIIEVKKVIKGATKLRQQVSVYAGDGCYCVSPYLFEGIKYKVYASEDSEQADFESFNTCATRQIDDEP